MKPGTVMMWRDLECGLFSTMVENHVHLPRMCAAKRLDVGEIVSSVLFYLTRDFRLDIIQYNTIHNFESNGLETVL